MHGAIIEVLGNAYQREKANERKGVTVSSKYCLPFNTFHSPGVDYGKQHDFLA